LPTLTAARHFPTRRPRDFLLEHLKFDKPRVF
jgi:hypothetical protein